MIDYLEELLGHAGELAEQIRRLTREGSIQPDKTHSLFPSTLPPNPVPSSPLYGDTSGSRWEETPEESTAPIGGRDTSTIPSTVHPNWNWEAAPASNTSHPLGEVLASPSPLLTQLERLERATSYGVESPAGLPPALTVGVEHTLSPTKLNVGHLNPEQTHNALWNMGFGVESTTLPPGGSLNWTEQADRAFRRDSRRYDGGFYLY